MKFALKQIVSSRWFQTGLGIIICAVSLYLALRNVDFAEIKTALWNVDLIFVGWALVLVGINTVCKAVRWQVLMGPDRRKMSLLRTTMAILAGQALNTIYPARVGDLGRVYLAGEAGVGRVFALGTIVVEKLIEMLSYSLLLLVLIVQTPLPGWVNNSVFTIAMISVLGLIVILLASYYPEWFLKALDVVFKWLPGRFKEKTRHWSNAGLSSLKVLQSRQGVVKLVILSVLVWGTGIITNQLTLLALNIHLPITAAMLNLLVLQISVSLPSVPANIGIFEYLCILSLAVFGVDQTAGLSYGILLHLIAFLPSTLIGLLYLAVQGWMKNDHMPQVS